MDIRYNRDRGLIKWQGFFMTEHVGALKQLDAEMRKVDRPLIDEFQRNEFDERIAYAMEYNLAVKLAVWDGGHIIEESGRVHYVDQVRQQLRLKSEAGDGVARVDMANVVGVEVAE
ncbi:YolD-like family protein [Cytobacillus gottheilii]|uniref:YolD-like family protein n=1 Tax=Cytobacillus gottheilii TaxID=859144 RepID=A0ABX8FG54_9BACI|nr:YolD-like family protein [Cytobacillus gottheilii]QVY63011.1 YolD-like family protein [Cytobacillus gottheilii]